LNDASHARRLRLLDLLVPYQSKTTQPLHAYPEEGGSGVTVYLKGENLHGNDNCNFQLPRLTAKIPNNTLKRKNVFNYKNETLRITSEDDLQVDIEYNMYCIRESSPLQPIGYHKIHTDCDYSVDDNIDDFYTDINCIDLGRYGPFRKQGTLHDCKLREK
jgi:hypothetical protein